MRRVFHIIAGVVFVACLTIGSAVALYHAWLPRNPGPDNSSPPPEAFGAMLGGFVGCAVAVATLVALHRSLMIPVLAWWSSVGVGSLAWVVVGPGSLDNRWVDAVLAVVLLGAGGTLGVGVGRVVADVGPRRRNRGT